MTALEDKLSGWTGPSTATEQDRQDRAERMIKEAVKDHPAFSDCTLKVYAKGSYANNTNVLDYLYLKHPKASVEHRSRMHHGSTVPDVVGNPAKRLDGRYWTDRGSRGELSFLGAARRSQTPISTR